MGKRLLIAGYTVGILLGVLGLVGVIVAPSFIKNFVTSNIKLEPGYDLYTQWLNPPISIYLNFYVYNLKNPDEFLKGERPLVEEIGPIVYREHIIKEQVMDNQNGTISYFERRRYEFDPHLSKVNESFEITTVNVAPVTVLQLIKYFPGFAHDILNAAFIATNDTFIVRKTVRQILFGYKDSLLATLRELAGIFADLLPSDEVGFFIGKNNSIDGYFNVFTGADDYKKVGLVQSWNHLDKMTAWTSDTANMINGTDGTILPPFVDKDKRLYIFNNDLCRSLYLMYNKTELIDDIEVYTFAPEPRLFASHTENPDNEGFCTPRGNCLPAGVLNLTACQAGVPIIMSSPHFLFADPKFLKDVDGLVPNDQLHNTYLSVEPTTGVLMKANKRLQFNMQLFKDSRVDMTKNLPEILYPLFWVDENFEIDQVNADKFRNQVMIPLSVLNVGKFVIFGTGLFIVLACGIYTIYWRKKNKELKSDRVQMINSSNSDMKRNGGGLNTIEEDETE